MGAGFGVRLDTGGERIYLVDDSGRSLEGADALAAVSDVLGAMSDHVVHLGEVGAGSRAKLVNNTLFSAQVQLADYAMLAGQSLGIDPTGLADVLMRSSSSCLASALRLRAGSMTGVSATQADLTLTKDVTLMTGILGDAPGHELVEIAARFVTTMQQLRATPGG